MRIAVFIKSTTLHKGYGGLETQNKVLCEGLVLKGHEITIFSPKKELKVDTGDFGGAKYIFIPADYKNTLFSCFKKDTWEKNSLEVFKTYHAEKPFDLVISQSAAGLGIVKNKRKLNVPVVSIAHGTTLSEFSTFVSTVSSLKDLYWVIRNVQYVLRQYFGRQREFILGSNKVVAVANSVKQSLLDETFISKSKVEVIHNGVDSEIFKKPEKKNEKETEASDDSKVKLVYTGRIEKSKGVFDLLNIFITLNAENTVLHFVGDGPDLASLKAMVAKAGDALKEKIIFHGNVTHENVVKILAESDIFVFPSLRIEGFPMNIIEAMFSGLPVVANDMGGISDAIEQNKTGFLIKAGNLSDFKTKLSYLLEDPKLRKNMGENARIKALNEFTIDSMIDKYQKVFEEVINKK
jgi:glycosyltransferase involved in cell wall biosynthesis